MLMCMVLQLNFAFIKSVVHKLHKATAPLGINLCWHFTGSLIDFSSSTRPLEIYICQVRPLLNACMPFDRVPQCAFQLRDAQAFHVTYFIPQNSSICLLAERCPVKLYNNTLAIPPVS